MLHHEENYHRRKEQVQFRRFLQYLYLQLRQTSTSRSNLKMRLLYLVESIRFSGKTEWAGQPTRCDAPAPAPAPAPAAAAPAAAAAAAAVLGAAAAAAAAEARVAACQARVREKLFVATRSAAR
jgi:hypothetical protein